MKVELKNLINLFLKCNLLCIKDMFCFAKANLSNNQSETCAHISTKQYQFLMTINKLDNQLKYPTINDLNLNLNLFGFKLVVIKMTFKISLKEINKDAPKTKTRDHSKIHH